MRNLARMFAVVLVVADFCPAANAGQNMGGTKKEAIIANIIQKFDLASYYRNQYAMWLKDSDVASTEDNKNLCIRNDFTSYETSMNMAVNHAYKKIIEPKLEKDLAENYNVGQLIDIEEFYSKTEAGKKLGKIVNAKAAIESGTPILDKNDLNEDNMEEVNKFFASRSANLQDAINFANQAIYQLYLYDGTFSADGDDKLTNGFQKIIEKEFINKYQNKDGTCKNKQQTKTAN